MDKNRLSISDGEVVTQAPCGIRCPNNEEPATLMCSQCLVYYHPACVNLNANLKIVGYVCIVSNFTVIMFFLLLSILYLMFFFQLELSVICTTKK